MAAKVRLAGFLGVLTSGENDYFLRSFEALGLPSPSHESEVHAPVLDGFRTLIGSQMARNTFLDALAVLLPAEWVYLAWARAAAGTGARPARFYLAEWIDLHADAEFAGFVEWLRARFDEAAARADDAARTRAANAFAEVLRLEAAFFDAAFETA